MSSAIQIGSYGDPNLGSVIHTQLSATRLRFGRITRMLQMKASLNQAFELWVLDNELDCIWKTDPT